MLMSHRFVKFQINAGELCLDFINTLDNRPVPERRQELIQSYEDLVDWAMQAGALSAAQRAVLLREAESHPKDAAAIRARAVELRECLYRIMTAVARHRRVSEEDVHELNNYLGEALSHLELRPTRKAFQLAWPETRPQLDFILWPIVRSASDLLSSHDLELIRECDVDTCRWLFVDRSKNHSRRWCDMRICGNRIKAQKFYRRQQHSS
jgi:predicted RNA-binding Zn ribbon-like protein